MAESQPTAQPLPLLDQSEVERLKRDSAVGGAPPPTRSEPDREVTVWYRLVTAISSSYVYVVAHTAPESCRIDVTDDGVVRCVLGDAVQWEVRLPAAAFRQFGTVAELWRSGALAHCLQVDSVRLGKLIRRASGVLSVDVLPAVPPRRRTRTLAR